MGASSSVNAKPDITSPNTNQVKGDHLPAPTASNASSSVPLSNFEESRGEEASSLPSTKSVKPLDSSPAVHVLPQNMESMETIQRRNQLKTNRQPRYQPSSAGISTGEKHNFAHRNEVQVKLDTFSSMSQSPRLKGVLKHRDGSDPIEYQVHQKRVSFPDQLEQHLVQRKQLSSISGPASSPFTHNQTFKVDKVSGEKASRNTSSKKTVKSAYTEQIDHSLQTKLNTSHETNSVNHGSEHSDTAKQYEDTHSDKQLDEHSIAQTATSAFSGGFANQEKCSLNKNDTNTQKESPKTAGRSGKNIQDRKINIGESRAEYAKLLDSYSLRCTQQELEHLPDDSVCNREHLSSALLTALPGVWDGQARHISAVLSRTSNKKRSLSSFNGSKSRGVPASLHWAERNVHRRFSTFKTMRKASQSESVAEQHSSSESEFIDKDCNRESVSPSNSGVNQSRSPSPSRRRSSVESGTYSPSPKLSLLSPKRGSVMSKTSSKSRSGYRQHRGSLFMMAPFNNNGVKLTVLFRRNPNREHDSWLIQSVCAIGVLTKSNSKRVTPKIQGRSLIGIDSFPSEFVFKGRDRAGTILGEMLRGVEEKLNLENSRKVAEKALRQQAAERQGLHFQEDKDEEDNPFDVDVAPLMANDVHSLRTKIRDRTSPIMSGLVGEQDLLRQRRCYQLLERLHKRFVECADRGINHIIKSISYLSQKPGLFMGAHAMGKPILNQNLDSPSLEGIDVFGFEESLQGGYAVTSDSILIHWMPQSASFRAGRMHHGLNCRLEALDTISCLAQSALLNNLRRQSPDDCLCIPEMHYAKDLAGFRFLCVPECPYLSFMNDGKKLKLVQGIALRGSSTANGQNIRSSRFSRACEKLQSCVEGCLHDKLRFGLQFAAHGEVQEVGMLPDFFKTLINGTRKVPFWAAYQVFLPAFQKRLKRHSTILGLTDQETSFLTKRKSIPFMGTSALLSRKPALLLRDHNRGLDSEVRVEIPSVVWTESINRPPASSVTVLQTRFVRAMSTIDQNDSVDDLSSNSPVTHGTSVFAKICQSLRNVMQFETTFSAISNSDPRLVREYTTSARKQDCKEQKDQSAFQSDDTDEEVVKHLSSDMQTRFLENSQGYHAQDTEAEVSFSAGLFSDAQMFVAAEGLLDSTQNSSNVGRSKKNHPYEEKSVLPVSQSASLGASSTMQPSRQSVALAFGSETMQLTPPMRAPVEHERHSMLAPDGQSTPPMLLHAGLSTPPMFAPNGQSTPPMMTHVRQSALPTENVDKKLDVLLHAAGSVPLCEDSNGIHHFSFDKLLPNELLLFRCAINVARLSASKGHSSLAEILQDLNDDDAHVQPHYNSLRSFGNLILRMEELSLQCKRGTASFPNSSQESLQKPKVASLSDFSNISIQDLWRHSVVSIMQLCVTGNISSVDDGCTTNGDNRIPNAEQQKKSALAIPWNWVAQFLYLSSVHLPVQDTCLLRQLASDCCYAVSSKLTKVSSSQPVIHGHDVFQAALDSVSFFTQVIMTAENACFVSDATFGCTALACLGNITPSDLTLGDNNCDGSGAIVLLACIALLRLSRRWLAAHLRKCMIGEFSIDSLYNVSVNSMELTSHTFSSIASFFFSTSSRCFDATHADFFHSSATPNSEVAGAISASSEAFGALFTGLVLVNGTSWESKDVPVNTQPHRHVLSSLIEQWFPSFEAGNHLHHRSLAKQALLTIVHLSLFKCVAVKSGLKEEEIDSYLSSQISGFSCFHQPMANFDVSIRGFSRDSVPSSMSWMDIALQNYKSISDDDSMWSGFVERGVVNESSFGSACTFCRLPPTDSCRVYPGCLSVLRSLTHPFNIFGAKEKLHLLSRVDSKEKDQRNGSSLRGVLHSFNSESCFDAIQAQRRAQKMMQTSDNAGTLRGISEMESILDCIPGNDRPLMPGPLTCFNLLPINMHAFFSPFPLPLAHRDASKVHNNFSSFHMESESDFLETDDFSSLVMKSPSFFKSFAGNRFSSSVKGHARQRMGSTAAEKSTGGRLEIMSLAHLKQEDSLPAILTNISQGIRGVLSPGVTRDCLTSLSFGIVADSLVNEVLVGPYSVGGMDAQIEPAKLLSAHCILPSELPQDLSSAKRKFVIGKALLYANAARLSIRDDVVHDLMFSEILRFCLREELHEVETIRCFSVSCFDQTDLILKDFPREGFGRNLRTSKFDDILSHCFWTYNNISEHVNEHMNTPLDEHKQGLLGLGSNHRTKKQLAKVISHDSFLKCYGDTGMMREHVARFASCAYHHLWPAYYRSSLCLSLLKTNEASLPMKHLTKNQRLFDNVHGPHDMRSFPSIIPGTLSITQSILEPSDIENTISYIGRVALCSWRSAGMIIAHMNRQLSGNTIRAIALSKCAAQSIELSLQWAVLYEEFRSSKHISTNRLASRGPSKPQQSSSRSSVLSASADIQSENSTIENNSEQDHLNAQQLPVQLSPMSNWCPCMYLFGVSAVQRPDYSMQDGIKLSSTSQVQRNDLMRELWHIESILQTSVRGSQSSKQDLLVRLQNASNDVIQQGFATVCVCTILRSWYVNLFDLESSKPRKPLAQSLSSSDVALAMFAMSPQTAFSQWNFSPFKALVRSGTLQCVDIAVDQSVKAPFVKPSSLAISRLRAKREAEAVMQQAKIEREQHVQRRKQSKSSKDKHASRPLKRPTKLALLKTWITQMRGRSPVNDSASSELSIGKAAATLRSSRRRSSVISIHGEELNKDTKTAPLQPLCSVRLLNLKGCCMLTSSSIYNLFACFDYETLNDLISIFENHSAKPDLEISRGKLSSLSAQATGSPAEVEANCIYIINRIARRLVTTGLLALDICDCQNLDSNTLSIFCQRDRVTALKVLRCSSVSGSDSVVNIRKQLGKRLFDVSNWENLLEKYLNALNGIIEEDDEEIQRRRIQTLKDQGLLNSMDENANDPVKKLLLQLIPDATQDAHDLLLLGELQGGIDVQSEVDAQVAQAALEAKEINVRFSLARSQMKAKQAELASNALMESKASQRIADQRIQQGHSVIQHSSDSHKSHQTECPQLEPDNQGDMLLQLYSKAQLQRLRQGSHSIMFRLKMRQINHKLRHLAGRARASVSISKLFHRISQGIVSQPWSTFQSFVESVQAKESNPEQDSDDSSTDAVTPIVSAIIAQMTGPVADGDALVKFCQANKSLAGLTIMDCDRNTRNAILHCMCCDLDLFRQKAQQMWHSWDVFKGKLAKINFRSGLYSERLPLLAAIAPRVVGFHDGHCADLSRHCQSLVHVDFGSTEALTDAGICALLHMCDNLRSIIFPRDQPDTVTNVSINVLCRRTLPPLSMFRELAIKAKETTDKLRQARLKRIQTMKSKAKEMKIQGHEEKAQKMLEHAELQEKEMAEDSTAEEENNTGNDAQGSYRHDAATLRKTIERTGNAAGKGQSIKEVLQVAANAVAKLKEQEQSLSSEIGQVDNRRALENLRKGWLKNLTESGNLASKAEKLGLSVTSFLPEISTYDKDGYPMYELGAMTPALLKHCELRVNVKCIRLEDRALQSCSVLRGHVGDAIRNGKDILDFEVPCDQVFGDPFVNDKVFVAVAFKAVTADMLNAMVKPKQPTESKTEFKAIRRQTDVKLEDVLRIGVPDPTLIVEMSLLTLDPEGEQMQTAIPFRRVGIPRYLDQSQDTRVDLQYFPKLLNDAYEGLNKSLALKWAQDNTYHTMQVGFVDVTVEVMSPWRIQHVARIEDKANRGAVMADRLASASMGQDTSSKIRNKMTHMISIYELKKRAIHGQKLTTDETTLLNNSKIPPKLLVSLLKSLFVAERAVTGSYAPMYVQIRSKDIATFVRDPAILESIQRGGMDEDISLALTTVNDMATYNVETDMEVADESEKKLMQKILDEQQSKLLTVKSTYGVVLNAIVEKAFESIISTMLEQIDPYSQLKFITNLDLSGSSITDSALEDMLICFEGLWTLVARRCTLLTTKALNIVAGSAACRSLKFLDLSECVPWMPEAIDNFTLNAQHLRSFYLDSNASLELTDSSALLICDRCPYIQELSLGGCTRLTDAGLGALASIGLPLTTLRITGSELITDYGLFCVADWCHRLKVLDICSCIQISDKSLVQITRGCRELQQLNISHLPMLTKVSLKAIASRCHDLRWLDITSCQFLVKDILDFANQCASLKNLQFSILASDKDATQLLEESNIQTSGVDVHISQSA